MKFSKKLVFICIAFTWVLTSQEWRGFFLFLLDSFAFLQEDLSTTFFLFSFIMFLIKKGKELPWYFAIPNIVNKTYIQHYLRY